MINKRQILNRIVLVARKKNKLVSDRENVIYYLKFSLKVLTLYNYVNQ